MSCQDLEEEETVRRRRLRAGGTDERRRTRTSRKQSAEALPKPDIEINAGYLLIQTTT